jgi:hypothetical protein
LKVSEFVKDPVIGQINLVIDRYELAVLRYGGRIENIVPTIHESDNDCDFTASGYDLLQRGEVCVDELGFKQQIFRRISGQGELGKSDHIRVNVAGVIDPFENFAGISLDVTHDNVYLCHSQTQLRRVFHESRAIKGSATAIVTKR